MSSGHPCGCDEALAWRNRSLEAERIIMRTRTALRRIHPELLELLKNLESEESETPGAKGERLMAAPLERKEPV